MCLVSLEAVRLSRIVLTGDIHVRYQKMPSEARRQRNVQNAADATNSPALDTWMPRNGRLGQVVRNSPKYHAVHHGGERSNLMLADAVLRRADSRPFLRDGPAEPVTCEIT